jgi:hypothetical protein
MTVQTKSSPVIFTESSLTWLRQATNPERPDPRTATKGQLIRDAVLSTLMQDIETLVARNGSIR